MRLRILLDVCRNIESIISHCCNIWLGIRKMKHFQLQKTVKIGEGGKAMIATG